MQLNRSTLILLGVSLLIIVGGLVLQEPLQMMLTTPSPTPHLKTILPDDLAATATRFVIYQGNDFTQIDRLNDNWQVTDGTALDDTRETHHDFVDGLLDLLSGFEYDSTFQSDELAQFDLVDSPTSIEIETPTDTYLLTLGNTNPDGDRIYMLLNDDSIIYLMPQVFEFTNIIRLATEPPYRQLVPEPPNATEETTDNLLFPDIFGYQITEFMIRDERDGSFIRYTQGELGTWIVDGTVVNEEREIDHVQAAINVSEFLFLEIEQMDEQVRDSLTNISILTLSMKTENSRSYTMSTIKIDESGFIGVLEDGQTSKAYALDAQIVNSFFEMIRQPPYANATE